MRRLLAGLPAALAIATPSGALAQAATAAGLYDGGQPEIAAGLELQPDGRFRYVLIYGAADERARGTWRQSDGGIVLNSDPVNAPVFVAVGSEAGQPGSMRIELQVPQGLPQEAFSALVWLENGDSFVADFESSGLVLPIDASRPIVEIALALPLYEIQSGAFPVSEGERTLRFRFDPNDLGLVEFAGTFLPNQDGALMLERFGRRIAFRRVDASD